MGILLALFGFFCVVFLLVKLIENSIGKQIIPDRTEHVSLLEACMLHEDQKSGRNLSVKYTYDPDDPTVSDDLRKIYNRSLKS